MRELYYLALWARARKYFAYPRNMLELVSGRLSWSRFEG